ncbi:C6 zinc finger domain protein [Aspergillus heterothallicus]
MTAPAQRPRRRAFTKRSRTGCRSCRIRHVKCDETPEACRNCTSRGWTCGGYEQNRLPRPQAPKGEDLTLTRAPGASGFQWATTVDEKRCVSFFLHRLIPNLTSFHDSSLWQQLILQMTCSEPAVYHAVVALGAAAQGLEREGICLPGTTPQNTWHQFALEESIRSFNLLMKRPALYDPQFQQALLVCCLLFVLLELAATNYSSATAHLRSGLAIIRETSIEHHLRRTSPAMLDIFLYLEAQAPLVGMTLPPSHLGDQRVYEHQYELCLNEFCTLSDVKRALTPLLNMGNSFLAYCWSLCGREINAMYGTLHTRQIGLISWLNMFATRLRTFLTIVYPHLNARQQRELDIIKLNHLALLLAIKTCLNRSSPEHEYFMSDYQELLSKALAIMDCLEQSPLILDTVICSSLFPVAAHCPDYYMRLQAIDALRAWPHWEGYSNSVMIANLVEEVMKSELRQLCREVQTGERISLPAGLTIERAENGVDFAYIRGRCGLMERWLSLAPRPQLRDALISVGSSPNWSCMRVSEIVGAQMVMSDWGNKEFLSADR